MRIYHCVESYHPSVGGMQEVVKQLSERMVNMGHEVYVLTRSHPDRNFSEYHGVKIIDFKIEGNPFEAHTSEEMRYVDFLKNIEGDIITFFAAQQWATNLALDHLQNLKAKKISVPTGYSGLYNPALKTYFEKMKSWIHKYDMNVYLSKDYRDINFAKENGVEKIVIIPNGASIEEFEKDPGIDIRKKFNIPASHKILFHVGSYTGRKGHKEGIELFLKTNLKDCTLLMIGNNTSYFKRRSIFKYPFLLLRVLFSFLGSKRIKLVDTDRKTTVSAYFQSDLFFFPSQIECSPIVLFEASAAGLPFFTTDVGNSKEIAEWTGGGELMETQKDENGFSIPEYPKAVTQLENLMKNEVLRKSYSEKGRQSWKEKFTWEKITLQYIELYKNLLS